MMKERQISELILRHKLLKERFIERLNKEQNIRNNKQLEKHDK